MSMKLSWQLVILLIAALAAALTFKALDLPAAWSLRR
jgi:uncharacterized membrane protein YtjA (UPF0391 family)